MVDSQLCVEDSYCGQWEEKEPSPKDGVIKRVWKNKRFQIYFGLIFGVIIETWIFYHAFVMRSGDFGVFVKGFIGAVAIGIAVVSCIKILREEW
ncbi:MAG: hypothetical protein U9N35_02295 [Euryarchaeota archaeon]|nr:hypothetical protein [Euryarchaeota archaeon]